MWKVVVCGDRNWTNRSVIKKRLERLRPQTVVLHGNCRGADIIGAIVARELGLQVKSFPADWEKYGKAAGPMRNQAMVDEGPDLVIAFHDHIKKSKGTADMIRRASKAGIKVEVNRS